MRETQPCRHEFLEAVHHRDDALYTGVSCIPDHGVLQWLIRFFSSKILFWRNGEKPVRQLHFVFLGGLE